MVALNDLVRWIAPLKRKIFLLISRAILQEVTNTGKTQTVKLGVLGDETLSAIERLQEYGFETYPYSDGDTECLVVFINGMRDRGIAIKCHNRELRPTDLEEGESRQYCKDSDDGLLNFISIRPTDDTIQITTKDGNDIVIDTNGILITDANDNIVTMDSAGILTEDTNGNIVTMDSNGIITEDTNGSTVTMDSAGILTEDVNGNTITMDSTGMILSDINNNVVTMSATSLKLETATTDVELGAASTKINGTNLEVLI